MRPLGIDRGGDRLLDREAGQAPRRAQVERLDIRVVRPRRLEARSEAVARGDPERRFIGPRATGPAPLEIGRCEAGHVVAEPLLDARRGLGLDRHRRLGRRAERGRARARRDTNDSIPTNGARGSGRSGTWRKCNEFVAGAPREADHARRWAAPPRPPRRPLPRDPCDPRRGPRAHARARVRFPFRARRAGPSTRG